MKLRLFLFAICLPVLGSGIALAWDTQTDKDGKTESWTSIYKYENSPVKVFDTSTIHNEHADLLEITLMRLGASIVIGKQSDIARTVVDLNASYFRPELRRVGAHPGPDAISGSLLEQRELPPVPQWAGVPDFSFSIDDWINKLQYCPPRPSGNALDVCHVYFGGWLAGFNSSHFGSQATLNYQRIHETALNLARRAAGFRDLVEKSAKDGKHPGNLEEHRGKVEEAELMALYYEGAAQHFLQDRWAIGHMWGRWGGPDYWQYEYSNDTRAQNEVGAASGLLHGSEAVTHLPDPVSSPYFPFSSAAASVASGSEITRALVQYLTPLELAQFRLGANGPLVPAIGDDRLKDVFDGQFGAEYALRNYTDTPINVTWQKGMMMECLEASMASVIRTLGPSPAGSTYGMLKIPMWDAFREPYGPNHTCTDMWMTNHSVYLGWVDDPVVIPLGIVGRTVVDAGVDKVADWAHRINNTSPGVLSGVWDWVIDRFRNEAHAQINPSSGTAGLTLRDDWVAITVRAYMADKEDPDGTTMARGGLGNMGRAQPGTAYGAASYLAQTDLTKLPERDPNGTDKEAVFGLFNKAGADYFCTGLIERLRELRGSNDPVKREVCRYLAARAWAGTDLSYHGIQRETRTSDSDLPAQPICELFDGDARINSDTYSEDSPEHLHPGYTRIRDPGDSPSAYRMAPHGISSESIANWCDKIPVLNLLPDQDLKDDDVVAEQLERGDEISVDTLNLGDEEGKITLATKSGTPIDGVTVSDWSSTNIKFKLPKDFDAGEDDFLMSVTRADGVVSVGRFIVHLRPNEPKIKSVTVSKGGKDVYYDGGDAGYPSKFQLLTPGTYDVKIEFETAMSTNPIKAKKEEIKLGDQPVAGNWDDGYSWSGKIEIPDGDAFGSQRGMKILSIQAATREGGWFDTDPDMPGRQPDDSRRLVADEFPLHVKEAGVKSGTETLYHAHWSDEPKLEDEDNILDKDVFGPSRRIYISDAEKVPASGSATLEITLTGAVTRAPQVTVGGQTVAMTGKDAKWSGTFDLAAIAAQSKDDLVRVVIHVSDKYGRNVDPDPRTPTTITLPDKGTANNWWKHYESVPGQEGNGYGGDDKWHKLGVPPAMSLVIILDGSGSMGDNGKMKNAKAGLVAALEKLPANVEVGAVTFNGCGPQTIPFTKDKKKMEAQLLAISPGGSTGFANAINAARILLETDAHPASREWAKLPLSDGEETCNGDVGAAMSGLEAAIKAHHDRQLPPLGDGKDLAKLPSDDPESRLPEVPCEPQTRTAYNTYVRDGGLHLDTVYLLETAYAEQKTASGECRLTLTVRKFAVSYASSRGRIVWGVNSQPSHTTRTRASSGDGADAVKAFREDALSRLGNLKTMDQARSDIDSAVRASVGKSSG